jgi:phosphocarrier protein
LIRQTARVVNELGMHMRAANVFANLAGRFQSNINVAKGDINVNGKSVMGLMMLAATCGTEIVLAVEGADESEAARELLELVASGFGEGISEREKAE